MFTLAHIFRWHTFLILVLLWNRFFIHCPFSDNLELLVSVERSESNHLLSFREYIGVIKPILICPVRLVQPGMSSHYTTNRGCPATALADLRR